MATLVIVVSVRVCLHRPVCPAATAAGHLTAARLRHNYTLGCTTLCNGVILFDDGGELPPGGGSVPARRGPAPHRPAPDRP